MMLPKTKHSVLSSCATALSEYKEFQDEGELLSFVQRKLTCFVCISKIKVACVRKLSSCLIVLLALRTREMEEDANPGGVALGQCQLLRSALLDCHRKRGKREKLLTSNC